MRPLLIVGLDPGLEGGTSHAVALQYARGEQEYRLHSLTALRTPLTPILKPDPDDWNLNAITNLQPDAVLVEVARGAVASGRDADPVLQINLLAGQIIGRLTMLGVLAVGVASGSDAAGWNWRGEIGVRGKGAAARDASVEQIVSGYIGAGKLPVGPRGGKVTHWQDAAGIAIAGISRVRNNPHTSITDALTTHTVMDEVILGARSSRKTARKAARKGERVWL